MSERWEYRSVPRSEVREGDIYANHATITKVVRGPANLNAEFKFDRVAAGEVLFRCGRDFACKGRKEHPVVVGRRVGEWESVGSTNRSGDDG